MVAERTTSYLIIQVPWLGGLDADFRTPSVALKPDGNGKLSKRDGDRLGFPVFPLDWDDPNSGEKSSGYRERGYYPEAFVNLLAFLGWNPGTDQKSSVWTSSLRLLP